MQGGEQAVAHPAVGFASVFVGIEDEEARVGALGEAVKDVAEAVAEAGGGRR